MSHRTPELGEKTRLYPHGYGFCQCGCEQQTKPSRTGVYPMYEHRHTYAVRISQRIALNKLKGKFQETLLNLSTITNEVELLTKFVEDYWTGTDNEKQLALAKLKRILNSLKRIDFPQPGETQMSGDRPAEDFTSIER